MTEQDRVNNAAKNVDERKRQVSNYGVPGAMTTQIMLAEKMPEKLASEQTKVSHMANIRASLGLKK